MSGAGGYKYHVIQFLEVPHKDVPDFVCVPRSWIQSRGPDIPKVKVSYPVEKPSFTEERVMNRKKKSDHWKSFLSVIRYSTDNYENAKMYIQQEINNSKKKKGDLCVDAENIQDTNSNKSEKKSGDHTLLSAKANEKTSTSTQNAISRATIDNDAFVMGMINALGWCVSSKSANSLTLKRKALPVPDKENRNKRFRLNEPDESDNQLAGLSNKALDWSSNNHLSPSPEDSDEDMCTQETPVEKFNDNNTEMRQSVNQNPSKTTHSLHPKIITQLATSPTFARWCMLMHELQEVFDNSMVKELINTIVNKDNNGSAPQNNDSFASASSDRTGKAPKLNKEKRNEKPLEEKDTDDDDDKEQPVKKKGCPKLFKKGFLRPTFDDAEESDLELVENEKLPPEYDANNSRWTLNYREPALGLVELMPHTGVYVCSANRLPNAIRFSTRYALAGRLLTEIFTISALNICTLTDSRAKSDRDETTVRPALDQNALTVLINYVTDHAKKMGWPNINTRYILRRLRDKMRAMRVQTLFYKRELIEKKKKKMLLARKRASIIHPVL